MKCANCGEHEGTENYIGDKGMLAAFHGMSEQWCECCVLKAQIAFCANAAAKLAGLEKELQEVKCS